MHIYFTCGLQLLLLISDLDWATEKCWTDPECAIDCATRKEWRTDRHSPDNESSIAGRETISLYTYSQIEQSKSVCDMSAKDNRQTFKKKKKRSTSLELFLWAVRGWRWAADGRALSSFGLFLLPPATMSYEMSFFDRIRSTRNHSKQSFRAPKRHAVSFWKKPTFDFVCVSVREIDWEMWILLEMKSNCGRFNFFFFLLVLGEWKFVWQFEICRSQGNWMMCKI